MRNKSGLNIIRVVETIHNKFDSLADDGMMKMLSTCLYGVNRPSRVAIVLTI